MTRELDDRRASGPAAAPTPARVVVRRKKRFLDLRLVYFTVLVVLATAWLGRGARQDRETGSRRGVGAERVSPPSWLRDHAADLAARGLWEESVKAYEEALAGSELDVTTRANLHFRVAEICRERLGRYEKAIAHYLTVKRVDPASPRVVETGNRIVACFDALGRTGDAQRTLDRITALKPRKGSVDDPVVAELGTRRFTRRDVEAGIAALPPEGQRRFAGEKGRLAFLQEGLVGPELLAQAARRSGLDKEDELRRRLEALRTQVLGQAYLQRELAAVPAPSEEDLALFHKANEERYLAAPPSDGTTAEAKALPLKDCRDRVLQDWTSWKRESAVKALFRRLSEAQSLRIDASALAPAPENARREEAGK